jgi:surface antigen
MTLKKIAALLAASLLIAACQQIESWTGGSETPASSQSAPAANANDQKQIDAAMQRAYTAPIGQQVTWSNPDSGDAGTIIAIKDGYSQQGAYCRQFQETVTAGGQSKKSSADACQMPDGSWKAAP